MANYKPNPTYYRVTWNQASPHDYTGLTGSRAGGLDAVTPYKYNNRVYVTGWVNCSSPVLSDGDSLLINDVEIAFSSTDTLADIIEKINMYSLLTDVIAHNYVSTNYLTLTNGMGHCGSVIELTEGTGALAKLGFAARGYKNHPSEVGSGFVSFSNGDTFTINGILVTMTTAGGLDQTGACATINALSYRHGVIATRAADQIQISSLYGQPWTLSGDQIAKLGFGAGRYGGSPNTYAQSVNKQLATMRWQQVVNQLELFSTPFMLNDQLGTGNYDGTGELTTMSFTVAYEHPDQIQTEDELNAGEMLTGTAAIKRAVARGLTASYTGNQQVFDPTIEARGALSVLPNPIRIVKLTANGIDTPDNIATIEGNITVSMIAFA